VWNLPRRGVVRTIHHRYASCCSGVYYDGLIFCCRTDSRLEQEQTVIRSSKRQVLHLLLCTDFRCRKSFERDYASLLDRVASLSQELCKRCFLSGPISVVARFLKEIRLLLSTDLLRCRKSSEREAYFLDRLPLSQESERGVTASILDRLPLSQAF
jgi:hypothetical protein